MTTDARLLREYRCQHCHGRPVQRYVDGEWVIVCGRCGRSNLIHECKAQRQTAEAHEVLEGLPSEMQALFGYEPHVHSATTIIDNVLHPPTVEI